MDNKIIALIVVIVLIIVGGVYILGTQSSPTNTTVTVNNSTNTTTNNTSKIIHNETQHANDTNKNETPKVNITAQEAQKIAIDASEDLGFPAKAHGTPTLFKWTENNRHTWVWDVPLEFLSGSQKYGSMDVDAYTGEVIMNE